MLRPSGTIYNLGSGWGWLSGVWVISLCSELRRFIGSSPSWTLKSFQSVMLLLFSHQVMSDSVTPWTVCPPGSSVCRVLLARILEWVATSFSRGSFLNRNRSCISCIGSQILYHWATREAQFFHYRHFKLLTSNHKSFAYSNFSLFAIAIYSLVFLSHMSISAHGTNSPAFCLSLF